MYDIEKEILSETDNGAVYRVKNIPNKMFEFFIHKRRTFKDGTCMWAIGVSPTANTYRGFTFAQFRGTKDEAEKRLDKIISNYSQNTE